MIMKKIVYLDMHIVLVNFQSGIDQLNKDQLVEYDGRLDEVPDIFGLMQPMENAIESYIKLTKHYNVFILSTSPWENETALIDKLRWVKKYLGEVAYKRLILSHHKNLNKGHYLIDDRLKNGAADFEGEHIHFGQDKFPDWDRVVKYLLEKAKHENN